MGIIDALLKDEAAGATALVAFLSLIVSVISLINSSRLKSYEFMIKHRLETYDAIKESLLSLKLLTRPEQLAACVTPESQRELSGKLDVELTGLSVLITGTEPQEYKLLGAFGKLKAAIATYFETMSQADLTAAGNEGAICFAFADIYLWALWKYLQALHKHPLFSFHGLFNKEFKRVYARAKKLWGPEHLFFERYGDIKELCGKQRK